MARPTSVIMSSAWRGAILACLLAAWPVQAADGVKLLRVARDVYAVPAPTGPATLRNGGRTNNSGILVGARGVVVIDPGPNREAGRRLLTAIRRITRKPIVAVLLTHAHPENVLAADAVAGPHAPVIASHRTYALMRDRCSECLQRLTALAGERAMAGTAIRLPDQTVAGTTERRYGGRTVELIHAGWGHTAGDLAVLDVQTGTLFAGGLANREVMPDMHEARTRDWIESLRVLEALAPRHVVPGEGGAGDIGLLTDTRGYLVNLLERVERTYRAQGSVFEVLADGELPRYARWSRYGEVQPLNIQHVYAELEKEDFAAR